MKNTITLLTVLLLTPFSLYSRDRVIYGEDDRKEIYASEEYWQSKSDSTLALVYAVDLEDLKDGNYKVKGDNYGSSYSLCKDEPFREQLSGAYCSGSLVAPNIIMTAGHCIRSQSACDRTKFVFGFGYKSPNHQAEIVKALDVYSCKKMIVSKVENTGADFALVEVDRVVLGREPLAIRREGSITIGQELTVIGHPAGIPTKIAGGANIRALKSGYFVANLDTYGGNSGSAVFNQQTGLVEGILVRGATDFKWSNGCYVSNTCPNDGCSGEDVTNVLEVVKYLN